MHLFFIRDVETGLVWMTKILTDPFSDFKLYYKAPLYLLKGELIDPGLDMSSTAEEQHARLTKERIGLYNKLVMAGLVPAIHVFAVPPRRGCPARQLRSLCEATTAGHDGE